MAGCCWGKYGRGRACGGCERADELPLLGKSMSVSSVSSFTTDGCFLPAPRRTTPSPTAKDGATPRSKLLDGFTPPGGFGKGRLDEGELKLVRSRDLTDVSVSDLSRSVSAAAGMGADGWGGCDGVNGEYWADGGGAGSGFALDARGVRTRGGGKGREDCPS